MPTEYEAHAIFDTACRRLQTATTNTRLRGSKRRRSAVYIPDPKPPFDQSRCHEQAFP
ncbi:unnamed protein product [Periconia digitata]|uniref:Uncharacterized protein n=1 Tax=Periconia digitata TaxID=1303443 RepID=A0A9W4ULG0_9PLEO|nr:unnamed protein product [Periconia digitata]